MTDTGFLPVRAENETRSMGRSLGAQAAVFAIGATSAVQLANFTVTALSIVCLLLVPGFLLMRHRGSDLLPLVLATLGWISFLASCAVNNVSVLWPNAVAPAAFVLYLVGLTVLTGRSIDLVAIVLAGIAAGTVAFFVFHGIALTQTGNFLDLWKYGIAQAVTILILFGLTTLRLPSLTQPVALAVLGLASLGLNFRAHALVCLLASAVLLANRFLGSRIRRGWQFAVVAGFGFLFLFIMPIAAQAGWFGPALQRKTIAQEATNLPLFLVGRTEPPMSMTAILERPWLGWGSAHNLTPDVYAQAEHLAVRMGFDPNFPFDLYWRLPVTDYSAMHSILLGSWAEGGVVAFLLSAWLLVACLCVVWNNIRLGVWAPLGVTMALQGIWDLLYSPWLYNTIAQYACIALFFGAIHFRGRAGGP